MRTFQLTGELLAQHCAGQVLCLDRHAEGRSYRLHTERPGPELNEIVGGGVIVDPTQHQEPVGPVLVRVDIRGVLEQRAGYHDYCGGWSDGHDAIADRMIEALETGDVIMVLDSPGGAHAGIEEAIRRVQDAKAEHGRRVYAYADEFIASAAYWWACVADEIYVPRSGMVGSIGSRSCHESIAGALAENGVEVTHFVWPGDGKIAFANDRPLSDVGRSRGERDVTLAGESFAAAVEAARGLSRDDIVALNADCLTGKAAVKAGLADGTASLEDVIEHALAVASGEENDMALKQKAGETYEKTTKERYESDAPEPEGNEAPEAEGDEPDEENEGDEPEPDAEAEPDEEDEGDEPDEEDEGDEPKRENRARSRAVRADASLAEIMGLRAGSSTLAVKNAARRMRATLDAVKRELGADSLDDLAGVAKAVASDAKRVAKVEAENKKITRERKAERRMAAARKLVAANVPGFARGEVYLDRVDAVTGKRTIKLAPEFQSMKLEAFESFVARKIKNGGGKGAQRTTPFDADQRKARSDSATPNMEHAVEEAKKKPAVIAAASRSGKPLDDYARAYVAQFPQEFAGGDPSL